MKRMNTATNPSPVRDTAVRLVKINFRFDVKQTGDRECEVRVPMVPGRPLVILDQLAVQALGLSAIEHDTAIELAEQAVLQEIVIKR